MVLCDGVRESEDEDSIFDLTGVRTRIEAPSFPVTYPRLSVFVQMSGHSGAAYVHIEVEQPGTDNLIHRTKPKQVVFEDPTGVVPVLFRLRNCVFPVEGLYYVQVLHEGKLIGERPLMLRQEE